MERPRTVARFLFVAVLLLLPAIVAVSTTDRISLHLSINAFHAPWADTFFRFATHLADGLVPVLVAILFLLMGTWRSFLMVAVSCAGSALVTQFLKRLVFPGMHRPGKFREELVDLHWLTDLDLNMYYSFPSGHATSAFSLSMALTVLAAKPRWAPLLALVAAVLAFSRVYLSQHFTEDIIAGAVVGMGVTMLVYHWLFRSSMSSKGWLERKAIGAR